MSNYFYLFLTILVIFVIILEMRQLTLEFDGSCWPNPGGVAGYGYVLYENTQAIHEESGVVGQGATMTNNVAEFYALYCGLLDALEKFGDSKGGHLTVKGDSQLVINVMLGKFKPSKSGKYYSQYVLAKEALKNLYKNNVSVDFIWVPRKLNSVADALSTEKVSRK